MSLTPDPVYPSHPECLVVLFDLREPGAAEMLGQERALWPEYTEVEVLDEVHAAVIRRPGWVSEAAA
jgi:hypothetical protein